MPLTGDIAKPNPLQVTVDKLLIDGGEAMKTNPGSEAVPSAVVRLTAPEVPFPTITTTVVEEMNSMEAIGIPPKVILVIPERLVPLIVSVSPFAALAGVNEVMVGINETGGKTEMSIVKFRPVQVPALGVTIYVVV
jgi:hypothetical protein